MNKFLHILWTYIIPCVLTCFTAEELTQNVAWAPIFYSASAFTILVCLCLLILKKHKNNAWIGIITAAIMSIFALKNQYRHNVHEQEAAFWNKSLVSLCISEEEEFEKIVKNDKDLLDANVLYKLGNLYFDNGKFDLARRNFQKSANLGIVEGYLALFDMDLYGFGCPPDPHQAVQNLIRASRIRPVNMTSYIERMFTAGISIPYEDSIRLLRGVSLSETTQKIRSEAISQYNKYGFEAFCRTIKHNYSLLQELSDEGYLASTELLYTFERVSKNPQNRNLHLYAQQMYKGGEVPTLPYERSEFLNNVYERNIGYADASDMFYTLQTYPICDSIAQTKTGVMITGLLDESIEEHIRNNIYPTIAETGTNIDFTGLTDAEILLLYRYLKSQYDYCYRLIHAEIKKFNLCLNAGPNEQDSFIIAKSQLSECISNI